MVTSIPLMRLGGLAASLATFALLVIIVHVVAQNLNQVTNGQSGDGRRSRSRRPQRASLVWCVIAMVLIYLFQESRWGLRLRASREDEVAARAYGIGVHQRARLAWILSAFLMGIGGALYGQFLGTFDANAFYLDISFMIIAMLVIGGRNSLAGAVVGSCFIAVVSRRAPPAPGRAGHRPSHIPARPGLEALGLGAIMVGALILRPNGLTLGREISWPFTRAIRNAIAPVEPAPELALASNPSQAGDLPRGKDAC